MKTILWNFFNYLTSIVFAVPFHFARKFYIQLFIKTGKNCRWGFFIRFYGFRNIKLGNDVAINRNVMLDGRNGLEIGDSVDIGEYVTIWSLEHDPNSDNHECRGGKVVIKDHVWIAPRAIILPNVTIERGAVVATNAVVTKNVPEKAIVAGIPAKIIGFRENNLSYRLNQKF